MKNIFLIFVCCSFAWTVQAQNMDKMSIYELDSLANYWQGEGKYDKAISFAKKAIEIAKKEKNDSLNNCLFRLGLIYSDMNETEKAEELLKGVLAMTASLRGTKHEEYYNVQAAIAKLYKNAGNYEEAEKIYKENEALGKTLFGEKDPNYALSLLDLGDMAYYTGRYEDALSFYKQAQKIYELDTKANAHYYGICLGNMAAVFSSLGRYEEAEPIYLKALALSLAENGKKHDYVNTLNNLAFLYFDMGRYEEAEANWKEAIQLGGQEDLLGKMHTNYADFLSSLASLYIEIGRYSEAEALLLEALAIYQQNYGKEHPSYATNSNNLAVLYYRMGQEEKAMPLYQEALRINAKLLGKEHPDYALQLSNVANAAFEMGKHEEAEQKMKEVLSIQKKALGEQHPTYAASLILLATLYQEQERFAAAGNLFWQAANTFEKTFGKEHPKYAEALNYLADFYLHKNAIDSARLLSQAAFAANSPDENIQPSKYGEANYYSNNSSLILLNTLLSIIKKQYQITGKPELLQEQQQIAAVALAFSKRIKNSFYAEGNKLELFKTTYRYATVGIASGAKLKTKESIENAFAFAEQNKSMLLADATKAQRARNLGDLPDSLSLKEQKLYYQLDQLKKTALAAGDSEKQAAQSQLNALNIELDAFKKLLEKNYPKYYKLKFDDTKASTEAVQKLLDKKSLFLEYFVADSMLYLFILRKNDVQLLSLNISAQLLSSKTAQMRKAISDYEFIKEEDKAYSLYTETAYWFYKNTLAPAIEASKDIDNLIIVADGELGHLPFEAFLTAEVKSEMAYAKLPYLLNKYKVSYNYSASIWKENLEKKVEYKNGKMLAIAATYKGKEDSLRTRANRAPHLRNLRDALQDLPAAKQEVEALGKVFSGDFLYGDYASEKFFKEKADKYGIIHLAMHGILNQRAPILSSLAFTENGDSTEDNFLEAWEISHLKLNAQLVVLSACETGYGKFQQGEGVMSLARSFMYAGVQSLVVSMWQVNDASTSAIMQLFYKNLAKGMNKAEALRQAKLDYINVVDNPNAAHPAYWAPFVLIGDDRPVSITNKNGSPMYWVIGFIGILAASISIYLLRRRNKNV